MSHELICSWLKLPADSWPPDHYTLLGLSPGEADIQQIELHVQERLEWLRRYQLLHPDVVTDGMNRLARAYVCLGNPAAKEAYDAQLLGSAGEKTAADRPNEAAPPSEEDRAETNDPLAWLSGPLNESNGESSTDAETGPIQVVDWASSPPPPRRVKEPEEELPLTAAPPEPVPDPVVKERTVIEARARQGLETSRGIFRRIEQTRLLLMAWKQVGRYLGEPTRKLTRRSEAVELVRCLSSIRKHLRGFPPLLGQAGQPGYLVVALGRQQLIVQTFLTLLPSQREALARDWQAGLDFLMGHRRFLRHELRNLRHKSRVGQAIRAVRAYVEAHLGLGLLLVTLLVLNLSFALPRWALWIQVWFVLAGIGLEGLRAYRMSQKSWLHRKRPVTKVQARS